MSIWKWFSRSSRAKQRPAHQPEGFRPALEALEERWLLTVNVTNHGGVVLPHVEVQAIYYGSTFGTTNFGTEGKLDSALKSIATGPYLDMLSRAGYGVGPGSFQVGDRVWANLGSTVKDSDIRGVIQNEIKASLALRPPDSNRLYVVYVEPNVEVIDDSSIDTAKKGYDNSVADFAGYHNSFAGTDAQGHPATIRYAVVTTPGGTVNNASGNLGLNTLDEMTEVTSHEVAEAVTDPDLNTWFQDGVNGDPGEEIGDLVAGQTFYQKDLVAVQEEVDQNVNVIAPTYYDGKVTLRASNGQYVTAEGGGGGAVNANRNVASTWETFTINYLGGNQVQLQTNNGHFLTAENGGGATVDATPTVASAWQTFRLVYLGDDKVAFQTPDGHYLSAAGGGGGTVVANTTTIGSGETFHISSLWLNLQGANGQYVTAEGGGGGAVNANRPKAQGWEAFQVHFLGNNQVAFQTLAGNYVTAEHGGGSTVDATRTQRGSWETFRMIDAGNGKVAFQTSNGKNYLTATNGGGSSVVANGTTVGAWELFQLSIAQ